MRPNSYISLINNLKEYKKRYFLIQAIKGALIGSAILLIGFLAFTSLEYFARFNSVIRASLLISYLALLTYVLIVLIAKPLIAFYTEKLSDTEAAKQIGELFPEIKDKLLNTIELQKLSASDNALINASLQQKTEELKPFKFKARLSHTKNKKYIKYAAIPLLILLFISGFYPQILSKGSTRIINFKKEYVPEMPFKINLEKNLKVNKGENITIKPTITGENIPEDLYILLENRKIKLNKEANNTFTYTFKNVLKNNEYKFSAAGFTTETYNLKIVKKPSISSINTKANYPAYLNKKNETFKNNTALIVPEGTTLNWTITGENVDKIRSNQHVSMGNTLQFSTKIKEETNIEISLTNTQSTYIEVVNANIEIIKDNFPNISLQTLNDSLNYNYIALSGNINDDYGLKSLNLYLKNNSENKYKKVPIKIQAGSANQNYYHKIDLRPFNIIEGDKIEYYLEVKDNDEINGYKSSKTSVNSYEIPKINDQIKQESNKAESELEKLAKQNKDLESQLNNLLKRLQNKKELKNSDKNELEKLLKEKQELKNKLKELLKKLENIQNKENQLNETEKENKIDDLIKELAKEESELLKQLKDALEKKNNEFAIKKLDELQKKNRNKDKDLERALKLLKEQQLKKDVKNLEKELNEAAEKLEKEEPNKEEEEQLKKELEELLDKLDKLEKDAKDQKKDINLNKEQKEDLKKEINDLKSSEGSNSKEKKESKRRLAKKLKKMADDMSSGMSSMEMKQLDIDLDAIRDIIENLLEISFTQEELIKKFKNIKTDDPNYVSLSQKQLKLSVDAKIIEDSLYSLANRVLQIKPTVTKELTEMKNQIDASLQYLKERKLNSATQKQHFALTSINNLALLLNESFKEMQSMKKMSKGKTKKKGEGMGMGDTQNKISKKMKGMGKGKNSMSQDLVEIAQEQAALREKIRQAQEKLKGTKLGQEIGDDLKEAEKEIEKLQKKTISKQLSPADIQKNEEIETRLMKFDKAIKEQETDNKRKAKEGNNLEQEEPKELQEFKKKKEKSIELIKTVPATFSPFYKSESNKYFNKINVPRGTNTK